MRFKSTFILFFVLVMASNPAFAQQPDEKKDSSHLYENIEAYSGRSKFTKFMYRLFFKPVADSPAKKGSKKKKIKRPVQQPYSTFEGKTIRHIQIVTLDPFGNSIGDTIKTHPNFLSGAGNRLHIKSQPITIRNLLLFRKNQVFDSLLVKESERLVRSSKYVTDVSFFIKATAKNSDSVDIYIRELDKWSLIPGAVVTNSRVTFKLTERNFLGMGHESRNSFTWHHSSGKTSYTTSYFIPNIRNTYINGTFQLGTDEFRNYTRRIAVDRPFYSPLAKWAAGVDFAYQSRWIFHSTGDSLPTRMRLSYNNRDFWAGNAIQIYKGKSEDKRATNFITAIRFLRVRYFEKPDESSELQPFYNDENFYLASAGISKRKYVQDKYIFKFGITEDVPVGNVFNLTGGYQQRANGDRVYLGARISVGNYYQWGYLGSSVGLGTFIRSSKSQQGILTAEINYFTLLKEIGKWKFRQFIKPELTIGLNRYANDSLTINDGYGLNGFTSPALSGTSRMLVTLQTQSYSPWNFIGFRFGPYFTWTFGMLGDETTGFSKSRVYSQFGLGVLIKNENLILNTFQVSIAFYPLIPGVGQNVIKLNPLETTDFGFRDFEIGKPAPIVFQ
ncbi:MAG: hypothetical protein IPH20_27295 [Bacteroidales bacterium]|nr:hypothetical protein [Bacteroidales bacterium]